MGLDNHFYVSALFYGRQREHFMKLLKLKIVISMTSLSKASIYRQVNAGTFPAPIRIGPRSVAWLVSEIESWIEERRNLRGS